MDFKIDLDELRKRKLMVCTPMYGGICEGSYMRAMLELGVLCSKHNIEFQFHCLFNESLITRARAYACDEFMRSDCTHMIFIDADVGFNPRDVLILLWLQSKESEYDVIGAAYPKKCISWEKIKLAVDKGFADKNPNDLAHFVGDFVFNPKAGVGSFRIDLPVEVSELGTGFMMIKRETLEKYKIAYPELSYKPDHVRSEHFDGSREIHMYFDTAIDRGYTLGDMQKLIKSFNAKEITEEEFTKQSLAMFETEKTATKRYLSEDYKFCYDVQRMGMKIWLCPWMGLSHSGKYVFGTVETPGLSAMAALGASPTADPAALGGNKQATRQPPPTTLPGLPGAPVKEKFTDRISKPKQ